MGKKIARNKGSIKNATFYEFIIFDRTLRSDDLERFFLCNGEKAQMRQMMLS
jgi:hypothetical protein